MQQIQFQQTLPKVFADRLSITSDVWNKDIAFRKGKKYLIEAASGTGKSSLCSFLYGYRKDYLGQIKFDETAISSFTIEQWTSIRLRSLSLLFQDLKLFPELTAFENVSIKNNLTQFKNKQQIEQLFEQLQIADKLHAKVNKLSFGQQQRVAFIRALCQPYDFIVLDEPVSHLDEVNSQIMARILDEEAALQEAGIIVTSIGKHIELTYHQTIRL